MPESGDIYRIGRHRLLCGDARDPSAYRELLGDDIPALLFTDPPYGVGYEGGHFHSNNVHIKRARKPIEGDTNSDMYAQFLPVAVPFLRGPAYCFFSDSESEAVYRAVRQSGCKVHSQIIWHKTNAKYAAIGQRYKQRHECILFFKPKGTTLLWTGPGNERTIWDIPRDARNAYHPSQKPIALAARALSNHDASVVLDPFLGAGSTLLAAEQAGRTCLGMEIDPYYVQVCLDRFAAAGLPATLLRKGDR